MYSKYTLHTQTESASAQKSSWELVPFTYILQHTDSVRQPANDIYNNMSISNNGFHHPVCSKYVTMYNVHSRISVHLEQIHVIHTYNEDENYVIIIIGIHEPQIGKGGHAQ